MPSCLLNALWHQFSVFLPVHPVVSPTHPLGCRRRRIADHVVFEQVVSALVHGSGYKRIASPGCSDRTIRRRVHEWAELGLTDTLHDLVLEQYDRLIGLELADLSVDGCITKAPGGGENGGRPPVDRGKQGLKRSTEEGMAKLGPLSETPTVHLDAAYDGHPSRAVRDRLGCRGEIARKGSPALLQAGQRWVVEGTQSWMNGYGKLRRTERTGQIVDFYRFLAAAFVPA